MPSASNELREFARRHFDGLDTAPIIKQLERNGFELTKDWCWKRKLQPTDFEWQCINFLVYEWDFGGYIED